jgi:hypothetical protein
VTDDERLAEDQSRRAMVRDGVRYACIGGALASAGVAALGRPALAISIALGTLLAAINFVLLARAVSSSLERTVTEVEKTRRERGGEGPVEPDDVRDRPLKVRGGPLRLIFFLLLFAALLFYPPAEPIGLGFGVIIVLLGGSVAALRHARTLQNSS